MEDWRFWDFGRAGPQLAVYRPTGEMLIVHGPGVDGRVTGGPFRALVTYNGQAVLIGLDGNDENRSLVTLDPLRTIGMEMAVRAGFDEPQRQFTFTSKATCACYF